MAALTYADDSWAALANGTPIVDADPGLAGDQNATFGVDAFATISGAVAAADANGTTIVSAGTYAETVTLDSTKTLEISAPAEAVTLNALNTAVGQTLVLEGTAVLTLGNGASSTLAGVISGSGSLVKQGASTLLVSGQNTFTGGTTVNAGTLNLQTGSLAGVNINPLGTGALTVNDTGNVVVSQSASPMIGPAANLAMSWFQTGAATALITGVGNNTATGGLLGAVPTGSKLLSGAVNFGNDAAFQNSSVSPIAGAPMTAGDNFMFLYRGFFTPAVTGTYQFGVGNQAGGANIDDEAAIYLDLNGDNLFNTAAATSERVAYQATAGASNAGTGVNLTAGVAYPIAIAFREGTSGSTLIANVQRTVGAPTTAWTNINSATGSGVGTFTAIGAPVGNTFASNVVNISGTASVEIQVPGMAFGNLNAAAGSTLNLNGTGTGVNNTVTFASAVLAGAVTINTNTANGYVRGVVSQTAANLVTKGGTNALTFAGANTYAGATNITAGTLRIGNQNALGTIAGGTTIAAGATLDINGFRAGPDGNEPISVEGAGVGGIGAIINTRPAAQLAVIRNLTMTGNVTFSSPFRWDIRDDGADPVSFDMNGFTLTKIGGGELCIVNGVVVDPGSVNVNAGIFRLEGSTDFDGTGTISVAGGATLDFWQNTQSFAVNIALANTANLTTNDNAGAGPTLTGTITLTGTSTWNLEKDSTFSGQITGTGGFNKNTGTGVLTLTNNTNNYAGTTAVNAGTLVATQPNSLGTVAGGTLVGAGGSLVFNATAGAFAAAEPLILNGNGVAGAGALQSIGGNVTLNSSVGLLGDTFIANRTAATMMTLNGEINNGVDSDLTLLGAGDFDINGNINQKGYSLSPFAARVFTGASPNLLDPVVVTNYINGSTTPQGTATLNGPLQLANLAAFNALFAPTVLGDNFTSTYETTLTVTVAGTYTFAVTNNDDGAQIWIKPSATAAFVASDRLYAAVPVNNNTTVGTRALTPGTYTLLYVHRENAGGEAITGRIGGLGHLGVSDATTLPIVNPVAAAATSHLIKTGTGSANLSGNNTYTGVTLVHQGTLTVDSNNALGASAPVTDSIPVGPLAQQWQVGIDNNTQTEFSVEGGSVNTAPGSATVKDDDYYLAGTYPAPIGVLGADEALLNFERAITNTDHTRRIHFNVTAPQVDDTYQLQIDTTASNFTGGSIPIQVYVNGVLVHSQTLTADVLVTTPTFTGASVNMTTGDNVVTITRTTGAGTGTHIQFDYIRLNRQGQVYNASNTHLEPGAALGISGGITSAESLVNNGGVINVTGGANTVSGTVNMLTNTPVDVAAGASLLLSGNASGAGGVTKTGTGTLTLAGTNTNTGATSVNAGSLILQNSAAISDIGGLVSVANGATLQLDASETVGSYNAGGTSTLVLAANTLTVNTGDAPLGNVTSTTGGVVAAAGAITDANGAAANVIGTSIYLQAATGIGSGADPIETAVSSIQLNNLTSGVVNVLNSNAGALLTVSDLRTLGFGARNLGGALTVVNSSPLTIAANTIAAGAIVLTASDSAAVGDDLVVNPGVTIQSTGATVTLNAGDIATIPATALIAAAVNVVINVDAGDADAGVGGTLNFAADVDAPLAIFNGLNDANGDTFNVRPDQDTGDVLTPIQVFGLAPIANPSGDALVVNITGLGIPTLTLGPGDRNGSFSFGLLAAPLTYNNVENVSTNPALPYHLVLDMRFSGYENGAADTILARLDAAGTNLLLDVNAANVFTGPDAVIQSLTIIGSNDNDGLTIQETAGGLPRFLGGAPIVNNTGVGGSTSVGSHLNSSADLVLETLIGAGTPWDAADVTMHFDGGAGTDALTVNYTTANSTGYFSDTNDAGNSGNLSSSPGVFPALGTPTLLMSFANVEPLNLNGVGGTLLTDATGTGATSSLTLTDIGATTQIVGDGGFATTTFTGFQAAAVVGGGGAELIDVVSVDNATLVSLTLFGGNTNDLLTAPGGDAAADTLRVRSLAAAISATLNGNAGNDLFQLFDAANTTDNILGAVVVDGFDGSVGGNTDTLTIVNTGGATADNALIGAVNAGASQDYFIDGITTAVSSDVTFRNVDVLNYTGTTLADTIDARLVNTIPTQHDLSTVNLSGWTGADQFLLFLSDQIGGSGVGFTPSGIASGVANINLFGDALGNPNAGDGNDTFGATPVGIVGTGATNVGLVVPDSTRMIRPSVTTSIAIDGGQPTGLAAPLGDVIGDVNNVDISGLPNTSAVIVSTFSPGTVVAPGVIQPLTWTQIEDINLVDQGKLTNVQMGDLFARATPGQDLIQLTRNPTALNPNQVRLRITATIGNYSVSNKTIMYGGGANDTITQSNLTIPAEFYGEAGDDYLTGAMNNDWLVGGDGNDRINGSGGDNVIWGDNAPTNPGDLTPQDSLTAGDDQLSGLGGNDVFYGSGGADLINGGGGNDYLNGGAGNDTLGGDDGDDRVYGGAGNDVMTGHAGNDLLSGGDGNDQLHGTTGNDVILGGNGADLLDGGDGNDLLVSGSVANENSTWTSVASTTTYSAATYTSGTDNDAALLTLLSQWGSASNRSSIGAITHDAANDDLSGGTGDDDFCWETADVLDNFPGISPNDFNATLMGTDERFGPT